MPVKVRCPTCEKVLNAPETARGKAIKCPGCETKVKVPAGDAAGGDRGAIPAGKRSTKKPAKKAADSDDDDFFWPISISIRSSIAVRRCAPNARARFPKTLRSAPSAASILQPASSVPGLKSGRV